MEHESLHDDGRVDERGGPTRCPSVTSPSWWLWTVAGARPWGAGRVGGHRRPQGAVVVGRRGDGVLHRCEEPYHDVLGVVSVDGAEVGHGRRDWGRRGVLSQLPWVHTPVGILSVVLWAPPA